MNYTLLCGVMVISAVSGNAFGMMGQLKPKKLSKIVEIRTFQFQTPAQQAQQRRADEIEQQKLVTAFLGTNESSLRARL